MNQFFINSTSEKFDDTKEVIKKPSIEKGPTSWWQHEKWTKGQIIIHQTLYIKITIQQHQYHNTTRVGSVLHAWQTVPATKVAPVVLLVQDKLIMCAGSFTGIHPGRIFVSEYIIYKTVTSSVYIQISQLYYYLI